MDIDGALAQAYALYKSGFKFWFDQSEIRDLTYKNEHYMSKSVEEELIETWLRPVTRAEWDSRNQYMNAHNIQLLTTTEIAAKLMEKVKFNLTDSTISDYEYSPLTRCYEASSGFNAQSAFKYP